jgi:class 3 adenylate cyclase
MAGSAQRTVMSKEQGQWADSVYRSFENVRNYEAEETLPILDSAMSILLARKDTCRAARVDSWRSQCFDLLGQLDSAVHSAQRGLARFGPHCDSLIFMSLSVNYSNALMSTGDIEQAGRVAEAALVRWNDEWPYSVARNGLYTNRAICKAMLGDMPGALDAFKDVLRNAHREGQELQEAHALLNIGAVFGDLSADGSKPAFLDSSARYQAMALPILRRLEDVEGMANIHFNLSALNWDRGRFNAALLHLDSAHYLAMEVSDLRQLSQIAQQRSSIHLKMGRLDSAYHFLNVHLQLKDSLLNTEKVRAIADVQEKYESEKKEKQILGLRAENLEGELERVRVKRTRNIYLFSGIGVLVVAGGLWNRLRFTRRSRAAIQKEKEISEGLLHNILPEEVADELKRKGYADVKEFEQATILFSDFKGFTQLSEKLSAPELVAEIDHCFKGFDGIMEHYRIEKIKTIGDAYMAAGGLPNPGLGRPADVVAAALAMQDFMASYKAERVAQGRLYFEMRLGIHTGPVIAGIVGVKKFAYDIWGDTVNTASRMESSGEVGRVNISAGTWEVVKDEPGLRFTPRGLVQAKGKGEMAMYFADRA